MNLAYANYITHYVPGIYNKLISQKSRCSDLMDFYLFTSTQLPIQVINAFETSGINVIYIDKSIDGYISKYAARYEKIVTTLNGKYDVVIMRFIPFNPIWINYFNKKKFILITEHHTKEAEEFKANRLWSKLLFDSISARKAFKLIDGVIAVTDEIRGYEISRGFDKHHSSIVISNGIDVSNIKYTGYTPYDGRRLNMIFVASEIQPWHGLDRVLRALALYKGNDVNLHIVGNINEKYVKQHLHSFKNIEMHGVLSSDEMTNIYENMNIAISVIGMHRKKMVQGCSLKTREYMARAIPFIYSYDDVDIVENLHYLLKISPSDETVNIGEIMNHCEKLALNHSFPHLSASMRDYALRHMDWGSKMQAMYHFAKRLFGNGS